nr:ARID DNA-binding domain-containing protein [Tanacetum cinerariifolium]
MDDKNKDMATKIDTSEFAKETKEVIKPTKPSVMPKYPECIYVSTTCVIKGTDHANWDDIWYISNQTDKHLCYKLDFFCNIKESFTVNKLDNQIKLLFTYGIREVFWTSAKVKTINEDARLQALVNGKKVIVNEASIRRDLRLDDAEGTACLPNAAIFEELARMRGSTNLEGNRGRQLRFLTLSHKLKKTYLNLPMIHYLVTNQVAKIEKLKKIVKKLEGKKKKRTHRLKRLYKIDADEGLFLINENVQDQGRMNDQDMFGVIDLDGDEVVVEASAREKEEQSEKVVEKEVSTADLDTSAGEVVTTADVEVRVAFTTTTTTDDDVTVT